MALPLALRTSIAACDDSETGNGEEEVPVGSYVADVRAFIEGADAIGHGRALTQPNQGLSSDQDRQQRSVPGRVVAQYETVNQVALHPMFEFPGCGRAK